MTEAQTDRPALRAARGRRGWSQPDAVRELATLAAARGAPIASRASLKSQLSRWENGHAAPDPQYRALLCELYGQPEVELDLVRPAPVHEPAPEAPGLRAALAGAAAVDDAVLQLWRRQLTLAHELDDRTGVNGAAGTVAALVDQLDRTVVHTLRPGRRRAVAALLAQASGLAAWQALDEGSPAQAWARFDRARFAASEARTPDLAAAAIAGQAMVLVDVGEPHRAAALLEHADDDDAGGSGAAWLALALGAAHAAAGEPVPARRAFDRAERALAPSPRPDVVTPQAGLVVELDDVHRLRGHALAALGDPAAVPELERALLAGPRSARDRAAVHAELAVTLSGGGRDGEAVEHARAARSLAERIGSRRVERRLDDAARVTR